MAFLALHIVPIITAIVALSYAYYRWRYRKFYHLASKIPGPKMNPIIGAAHLFIDHKKIIENALQLLETYGTPLKLWVFSVLIVLVSKPNQVRTILNNPHCLEREERYKLARAAFGDGLLTAPVPVWKKHRKLITPTFNQKILNTFMDVFVKQSEILVQQLEKEADRPTEFDVHEYLSRCSLDIICETAIGIKVEAQTKPSKLLLVSRRLAQLVVERAFKVWQHSDFVFKRTSIGKEFFENLDYMHNFSGKVVHERKQAYIKNKHNRETKKELDYEEVVLKSKPLLEHLLSLDVFSDLDLRNEVDTFIHSGSDTTTTTSGYVLVALGIHQEIQEKVYEEICDVFGNSDRPIALEDLPKLVYLEMVIKETMRLFPVAPFVARNTLKDIDLGDYVIPQGAAVVIPIAYIHVDPNLWPNPKKFDPDRFLPEEVEKRDPYCYIPFSAGPRNCIASRYAMMNVKTVLTTILRRFHVHSTLKQEDLRFSVEIIAKLIGGPKISLTERTSNYYGSYILKH